MTFPAKWDLADPLPESVTEDILREMIDNAQQYIEPVPLRLVPDTTADTVRQSASNEEPPHAGDPCDCLRSLTLESATGSPLAEALRHFGEAVGDLDPLERNIAREDAMRILKGLGASRPACLVDTVIPPERSQDDRSPGQGSTLLLEDPEPWPEPVVGAELLSDIVATLRRYAVLPEGAAEAVAFWVVFAHAHDAFAVAPILALTSPEKRCGKTTVLILAAELAPRPLRTANVTAAVVFRAIDKFHPTLVIDEADTFLRDSEDLRGILNSSHTKAGAAILRCEGDGHDVRVFSTWAPVVIALIGALPSTLEDRAINISMRRKSPGETVERFRIDRTDELRQLCRKTGRWVADNIATLQSADPSVPDAIQSDRARDNWRPLLAIADAAGGEWPSRAREVAVAMSGGEPQAESNRVLLLQDLRDLFASRNVDQVHSDEFLGYLRARDDRPWSEYRDGRAITAPQLAKLLKPFGIRPTQIRIGATNKRGYLLADCTDAFARYLPGAPEPLHLLQDSPPTTCGASNPLHASRAVAGPAVQNILQFNNVAAVAPPAPLSGEEQEEWEP
jgi:putative DNA primase/helicase